MECTPTRASRRRAPLSLRHGAVDVRKSSGRLELRSRQRREEIAPLALDAVPVLRDEARAERRETGEPSRRVAGSGERDPDKHVRILLRDARVAPFGVRGATGREPARGAERNAHADEREERPDEGVDRDPVPAGASWYAPSAAIPPSASGPEPAEAERERRRAGLRGRAEPPGALFITVDAGVTECAAGWLVAAQ